MDLLAQMVEQELLVTQRTLQTATANPYHITPIMHQMHLLSIDRRNGVEKPQPDF